MAELRKCCNHPFLIRGAEERILNDATDQVKAGIPEGQEQQIDYIKIFGDQLVKSSGKMVLINKVHCARLYRTVVRYHVNNVRFAVSFCIPPSQLLPKLFANGHKVLIFSQMVRALDLLEELLKLKRYKYERLDGSTSSSSRAAAVERFIRKSCQRFVMLLSTRVSAT